MNLTLLGIVLAVYFVSMIGISILGRRYAKTYESYLNIGRNAGVLLIMGGAIGGHIGNGFVVGGAGSGAELGVGGIWYGLGCALSYVVLSFAINDFVYRKGYISLSDFLRERYGDKITTLIYSLSTAFSFIGNMAAQIMAGKALFIALGLDGNMGAIVIAVVVLIYSQIAGLWGAFATSVVQTGIILVGLIGTTILVLAQGGVGIIAGAVSDGSLPASFFTLVPFDTATLIMLVVPTCLAIFTDQCAFQRINSAKDAATSKKAHLFSMVLMIPLAIMPVFIGMFGAAKFGVRDTSSFFTVVMNSLPSLMAAILVAAVVAAVMSTIDTLFIGVSAVVLHDLYKGFINPEVSEESIKKMNVVLNIAVAGIALLISLKFTSIVGLLSSTYTFLASSCLVPFLGGLLWKKGTAKGSVVSSVSGMLIVILNMIGILPLPYASVFPILPAFVIYVVVSLCTQSEKTA